MSEVVKGCKMPAPATGLTAYISAQRAGVHGELLFRRQLVTGIARGNATSTGIG